MTNFQVMAISQGFYGVFDKKGAIVANIMNETKKISRKKSVMTGRWFFQKREENSEKIEVTRILHTTAELDAFTSSQFGVQ